MSKLLIWFTKSFILKQAEWLLQVGFPWKITQMEIRRQKFYWRVLLVPPLWKGKVGSKAARKKKLNCEIVSTEASAANMFPSETGMTHQNCPKVEQDGWVFISPNWSTLDVACPGKWTWPRMGPSTHSTASCVKSKPYLEHWPKLSIFIGEGNGTPLQYSCLENPMDGGACRLQSMGSLRVGHDWVTSLSPFTFMHWRRKWQPTPVFLSGESQGRRSLEGCRLWGSHRVRHNWIDLAAAAAFSCTTPFRTQDLWPNFPSLHWRE